MSPFFFATEFKEKYILQGFIYGPLCNKIDTFSTLVLQKTEILCACVQKWISLVSPFTKKTKTKTEGITSDLVKLKAFL